MATPNSYNTTNLAQEIALTHKLSRAEALRVVETVTTTIINRIAAGDIVRIHGLGNFKKIETAARSGRNPKTGDVVQIDASSRPHFVAAEQFKSAVKTGIPVTVAVAPVLDPAAPKTPKASKPAPAAKPTKAAPQKRPVAPVVAPAPVEEPEFEDPMIEGEDEDSL